MRTWTYKSQRELKRMRQIVESFGLPLIIFRKFNGILNAIEMQVEDEEYDLKVVEHIGKALTRLAEAYDLDSDDLSEAFGRFYRRLQ